MNRVVRRVVPLLVVAAAACAREHLSPGFGRANREAFQAQQARPADRPAPPPSMGLDAQEAEVIGGSYLKGLAGKQTRPEPAPVLFVAPPEQNGQGRRVAPSVPKD